MELFGKDSYRVFAVTGTYILLLVYEMNEILRHLQILSRYDFYIQKQLCNNFDISSKYESQYQTLLNFFRSQSLTPWTWSWYLVDAEQYWLLMKLQFYNKNQKSSCQPQCYFFFSVFNFKIIIFFSCRRNYRRCPVKKVLLKNS